MEISYQLPTFHPMFALMVDVFFFVTKLILSCKLSPSASVNVLLNDGFTFHRNIKNISIYISPLVNTATSSPPPMSPRHHPLSTPSSLTMISQCGWIQIYLCLHQRYHPMLMPVCILGKASPNSFIKTLKLPSIMMTPTKNDTFSETFKGASKLLSSTIFSPPMLFITLYSPTSNRIGPSWLPKMSLFLVTPISVPSIVPTHPIIIHWHILSRPRFSETHVLHCYWEHITFLIPTIKFGSTPAMRRKGSLHDATYSSASTRNINWQCNGHLHYIATQQSMTWPLSPSM